MSASIYYFSGTGNSLIVARDIAEKTEGKIIPIKSTLNMQLVESRSEAIGIVFPAYYMRMPRIVESFINKLNNIEKKYIFSIVTVGGIAGNVLTRLSTAINQRGGTLSAGFIVRMPANYIDSADAVPKLLQKRMFKKWKAKSEKISLIVNNRIQYKLEKFNPIATFLFSGYIEKSCLEGNYVPDIDRNFWVDEKCTECGICIKICPVDNIIMNEGKPFWKSKCEKCLACIQWCPEQSIQFGKSTLTRKRYHHPEVTLSEMMDDHFND